MSTKLRLNPKLRRKLIAEVKAMPELYDLNHPHYKDLVHRDQAWLEIAVKLGETSAELVKYEWKIMRDSYRQAARRQAEDKTTKKWIFEKDMEFLQPNMMRRESGRYIPKYEAKDDAYFDTPLETTSSYEIQNGDQPDASDSKLLETFKDGPQSKSEDDGLEMFFASVCQGTKRLPKNLQRQVKRKVLDVLLKAEEEAENDL